MRFNQARFNRQVEFGRPVHEAAQAYQSCRNPVRDCLLVRTRPSNRSRRIRSPRCIPPSCERGTSSFACLYRAGCAWDTHGRTYLVGSHTISVRRDLLSVGSGATTTRRANFRPVGCGCGERRPTGGALVAGPVALEIGCGASLLQATNRAPGRNCTYPTATCRIQAALGKVANCSRWASSIHEDEQLLPIMVRTSASLAWNLKFLVRARNYGTRGREMGEQVQN